MPEMKDTPGISHNVKDETIVQQPRALTAFISGPIAPSPTYFTDYYAPRVLAAVQNGDSFILGPSRGIDTLALNYLLSQNVTRSRIHVYMFETEARNQKARVESLKKMRIDVCVKGKSHTQRDYAMTEESDYDILKYLTKEECMALYGNKYRERISGTELNERRRAGKGSSKPCG